MKRTQLYLDDHVWDLLHILARQSGTTVSDLVRQEVKEKYVKQTTERKKLFQSVVGLWKDRTDIGDAQAYVRRLRKDTRLQRISR